MSVRLFEGKEHALSYWKYRISPSEEIINKILNFLENHRGRPFELAVDVGCGSGQGTVLLGPHFTKVVGTDVSPAQLEMALQHTTAQNITYRECPAEQLPFENTSVDLVTSMSAFHWFDHPRFLKDADRILKPHGCLALLNYAMDMELSYGESSDALNKICKELYAALKPFRNPYQRISSITLYKETYDKLEYPVKEWHENLWVRKTVPLSSYIGFIESFSSYQAMLREDPEKAKRLSQDTTDRLLKAMGVASPDTEVVLSVRGVDPLSLMWMWAVGRGRELCCLDQRSGDRHQRLYSALMTYWNSYLGDHLVDLYKKTYDTLEHPGIEWLLKVMGVTSPDTDVVLSVRYYCLLARKPHSS